MCGSDGKTYDNKCLFKIAQCEARKVGKKLTLKNKGKCVKCKLMGKQGLFLCQLATHVIYAVGHRHFDLTKDKQLGKDLPNNAEKAKCD